MNNNMIDTAYYMRIYPNDEQKELIDKFIRTNHFIYNFFLRQQKDILEDLNQKGIHDITERKKYMKENELYFNWYDASSKLTEMAQMDEYWFLKIPPSSMRTFALKNLDKAFKNMWKNGSKFPKFKKRFDNQSYTCQIKTEFKLKLNNDKFGYVNIPKIKNLLISFHYDYFAKYYNDKTKIKINSATITKQNNQYHISFQVKSNEPRLILDYNNTEINKETAVGVDFGINRLVTTSKKIDFSNELYNQKLNLIKKHQKELTKLQTILNHKKEYHKKNNPDSEYWEHNSYIRVKNKIGKIHTKIRNIRENIHHRIAHELLKPNNVKTIVLEDLKLKNMMKKSAKGKSNNKSGLNRALGDVGLRDLRTKIEILAKRMGKHVIVVPPQNTSLMCSNCGYIDKKNRKTQANFKCIKCDFETNADYNAAINIFNRGFDKKVRKVIV